MIVTGSLSVRLLVSHLDWRTFYTTKEWGGGGEKLQGQRGDSQRGEVAGNILFHVWLHKLLIGCRQPLWTVGFPRGSFLVTSQSSSGRIVEAQAQLLQHLIFSLDP